MQEVTACQQAVSAHLQLQRLLMNVSFCTLTSKDSHTIEHSSARLAHLLQLLAAKHFETCAHVQHYFAQKAPFNNCS